MSKKYLATFILLISIITGYCQNGLTKYDLHGTFSSRSSGYFVHNNLLYFSARSPVGYTIDLWEMDGINQPKMIGKGHDGGLFPYHYIVGGKEDSVLLLVHDPNGPYKEGIYAYDLVNDTLKPLVLHNNSIGLGGALLKNNKHIFYLVYDSAKHYVYRYNIASGQSSLFATATKDTTIQRIYYANNAYYAYCIYTPTGSSVFKQDIHRIDTITKSVIPQTLVQGSIGSGFEVAVIGPDMYFTSHTLQDGGELYKYSGTGQPQKLTDIGQGNKGYVGKSYSFGVYNNKLYFNAGNGVAVRESLYEYDISTGTTQLIYENGRLNPNEQFEPQEFYVFNNRLYMSGMDKDYMRQTYVYDGADTPQLLTQMKMPFNGNSFFRFFTEYKGELYFTAVDDTYENYEMFRFNDSLLRPVPQSVSQFNISRTVLAYPNPTTQDTYLDIQLKEAQNLSVQVSDIGGRIVYALDSKLYSQGKHSISLPMANMPPGTYFYSIFDRNAGLLSGGQIIKQ